MDLTFFNPHSQTEADFLANFVARGEVLDYYLRQLRLLAPNEAPRHHLIVALRGYGKTSLLRRIAIAVRVEPSLSANFIALTFREEQHNVISLDVFWRNCLQSLLEAREDEQASEAEIEELDAVWAANAPRQDLSRDDQDGHPAWREFQARCNRLGRRPLLLIDNLDSLLAGLPEKHQWALRGILQQEGGPVLIAAAPRFPESTHDPAAAFYDFFRIESLDKFSDQEVMHCLRTTATRRGAPGRVVLELLEKDPGRIAALNTLAGGNPRTLSVLYSVLESHMSADVLSQLSAMLDTFTSWYDSRSGELPSQARAVFDALALNWDPMTAAAVGTVTGLDTTAVSSQISRLEKSGLVEAVALNRRGKGRSGYQLSERFFNIWYLMRNGPRRARQSIKFLAVFLQSCFSITERRTLAQTILDAGHAHSGYALGLAASLRASLLRERLLDYAETQSSRTGTREEYEGAIQEMRRNDGRRKRKHPQTPENLEREPAKLDRVFDRLHRGSEPGEKATAAKALVNNGVALGDLGQREEAIEVFESVVARFGDASEPVLREQVARALFNKGFTLTELGRREQAIEVFESVVARFGDASEPALRERVARALVNKGATLGQLGHPDEAIEAFESVVARFDASESALCEQVARALVNKGTALRQLGHREQAIEVFDSVVARFGDAPEPALREQVAWTLVIKGAALDDLGRREQAIEVFDSVVARFGGTSEPALRQQLAMALVNKAAALSELGHWEQAIEVYESVVTRFGDASEPALREQVAWALFNKGAALNDLGHQEQAIEVYESVVARFGDASEPTLREQVARALVIKGAALRELGQWEQAIEVYESVVTRFGDASEPALREQVAWALFIKGTALGQLGHHEQAIDVFESVAARFGDASEPALCEQLAMALVKKGFALSELGHHEQAIDVFESVVARFGDASGPTLRELVAMALVVMGSTLAGAGATEKAAAAFQRAAAAATGETSGSVGIALGNLLLDQLGDPAGALAAYEVGLAAHPTASIRAMLHANCAYALALHVGDISRGRDHALQALADEESLSPAGRHLLGALTCLDESPEQRWPRVFEQIRLAVECGDPGLWSRHHDDLQRLIWFILARGEGPSLRRWMDQTQFPLRCAPLYQAIIAATEGEDLLLRVNPETRAAAARIHEGIARRLALYGGESGKSSSGKRKRRATRA